MEIFTSTETKVYQAPLGYRCFQIGCVFVEYDLLNTTTLYLTYIRFGIIHKFDVNFLRQEHQKKLNQLLRFSGFSLYSLSFFLYSPFKFGSCTAYLKTPEELNTINPIPAGVLENQDMLGGGQFDPPL